MRAAALILLLATPAAASPADYAAAYRQARTRGLAHMEDRREPSCRRAIGARAADLLLEACDRVVGGSTRNACTPADTCARAGIPVPLVLGVQRERHLDGDLL